MSARTAGFASRLIVVILCAVLGENVKSEDKSELPPTVGDISGDQAYKRLYLPRDRESRRQRLVNEPVGDDCNVEALTGMPDTYVESISKYIKEILTSLNAVPISRPHFYAVDIPGKGNYPRRGNAVFDRNVRIPLVILPRPETVNIWAASAAGRASEWRPMDQAFERLGSVYGRSVIFKPGPASKQPSTCPALPYESGLSPGLFVYSNLLLKLGKLVVTPEFDDDGNLQDMTSVLKIGSPEGATLHGEFITTPVCYTNSRLRWVWIQKGNTVRRFLGYSLVDGNGACRSHPNDLTTDGISSFVRPLICSRHEPKIDQHDELLLPAPKWWRTTRLRPAEIGGYEIRAREDWCLDDWFPAQKDACWVIRESEDSKPLTESFLLAPASEKSDRPVFFIALFAETEPKQLVKELATLYKVSPDVALNSPEIMARLNSLYEKVRDFPLGK